MKHHGVHDRSVWMSFRRGDIVGEALVSAGWEHNHISDDTCVVAAKDWQLVSELYFLLCSTLDRESELGTFGAERMHKITTTLRAILQPGRAHALVDLERLRALYKLAL